MKNPKPEVRDTDGTDAHGFYLCQFVKFVSELRNLFPSQFRVSRSALRACLAFSLLTSVLSLQLSAQNYSIDWHTIDGGGGTSTGGVYSVSGTIGQPDASATTMTGGPYSLTGGFWSIIVVQTPGAPTLKIVPAGAGQATISWTPGSTNFVLQETLSLSPTNWMNSASGTNNPVTVSVPGNMKFYRLFKP